MHIGVDLFDVWEMVKAPIIFRGRILNPVSYSELEDIPNGALVVSEGKIIEYGRFKDIRSSGNIVDFEDKLIAPGLIDTHVHLPQYDVVAMDCHELPEWLDNYIFPAERRFESTEVAGEAAARFFNDLKANGTTTACVYSTVHKDSTDEAFKEAYRSGLRIFMGKVMMDQNSPEFLQERTAASVEASEELCKKWHRKDEGRLNYVFTPRFAPTCSLELMKEASKLARKYDAYIQTHLSENRHEIRLVKTLFPEYRNYTHVYESAELLTPKTIMAHCIYLEDDEISTLRKYSAKVAHCPSSNFFLKSGIFNANRIIDAGLDIGLGSDVGGGPNLSILKEMSNACYMSKVNYILSEGKSDSIDSTFAFYLATMGGAKVLGLEHIIGNFSVGKQADFVVLDAAKIDPLRNNRGRKGNEILSQVINRGDDMIVSASFVRGVKVYGNN
jgi:guanine deaminase